MIGVQTFYSPFDEFPYVVVDIDGRAVQLTPEEARELSQVLMSCAAIVEQDAFLVDFLSHKLGHPKGKVGELLQEFKVWRQNQAEREEKHGN